MLAPKAIVRTIRPRRVAARWVSATLMSLCVAGRVEVLAAQQQVPTDYVFIIDVSASMVGVGGSANIFPQVKTAVNTFLGQIAPGSEVFIAPFAEKVYEIKHFPINSSADAAAAQSYVSGLVANGAGTAIFNSVNSIQGKINESRVDSGQDRTVVFFLYTDGNDNISTGWNLPSFLRNFSLKRGERDWLFYSELGLPADPAKQRAFSPFERMRYVQQARGDVHPIVHVETLLPVLNFGNLKKRPNSTRTQKFAAKGLSSIPGPVSIGTEVSFPTLKSQGVLAQLQPRAFAPADSVQLRLTLVNADALADGDYNGVLRLTPSDPLVLVVPSEVEIRFSYGEDQEVTIAPGSGTSFPLDFGELQLAHQPRKTISKAVLIRFSSTAITAGKTLRFAVEDSSGNPKQIASQIVLAASGSRLQGVIPPGANEIALQLSADSTLPRGTYHGQIRFEGDGLIINGSGLTAAGDNAATLAWSFEVKRPPIPLWIWGLIAALLALVGWLLARHLMKPATFSDLKLELSEPQRQQIDLSGKSAVLFGGGREFLPLSKTTFSIKARKSGKQETAVLNLEEGSMLIKKQGTRDEATVIGDEEIFDGDVLHFGDHRARVSSFSLVRE